MNKAAADRDMDAVFQALAHESRRRMLDIVRASPGISVGALASKFDVSRIAVMKHLAVLEDAQLVSSEKEGRTRRLFFNAVPIQLIYDRWTDEYAAYWGGALAQLKYRAEARASTDQKKAKSK
jgi:DNA-binding transcriptional ArsR family regulator